MPWKPSEPGEVPTLGWIIIDWISEYLAAPDRGEYEPFVLYPEQEDFVLRFYELDPRTGRRRRQMLRDPVDDDPTERGNLARFRRLPRHVNAR